jgi:hypothetical protein
MKVPAKQGTHHDSPQSASATTRSTWSPAESYSGVAQTGRPKRATTPPPRIQALAGSRLEYFTMVSLEKQGGCAFDHEFMVKGPFRP